MTETCTTSVLSPMRTIIAARMRQAAQTIPHFRGTVDVNICKLLALRARTNVADASAKITVLEKPWDILGSKL